MLLVGRPCSSRGLMSQSPAINEMAQEAPIGTETEKDTETTTETETDMPFKVSGDTAINTHYVSAINTHDVSGINTQDVSCTAPRVKAATPATHSPVAVMAIASFMQSIPTPPCRDVNLGRLSSHAAQHMASCAKV